MRVRDRLGTVFADEPFADAFGVRGAPGLSPGVLSLVTVLQFAEDLTDRQAAAMAVRAIDWKYALGMELTDTGFDQSVLSRFRARLAEHGMERVVFDRLLEHCKDAGLVAAGGKQRTDSTHVISAVRDLNRLELAGESVRAALEALAVAAPDWLTRAIDVTEFAHRYGPRVDGWRMPSSQTKRDRLAQVFGQDALALCRAVHAPDAPQWLRQVPAVDILRRVLVQTYDVTTDSRGREVIKKREADDEGVPPGHLRLTSPYDPDARWAAKGEDLFWMGYKIHLTETCHTPAEAEAEAGGVPAAVKALSKAATSPGGMYGSAPPKMPRIGAVSSEARCVGPGPYGPAMPGTP
ncbi:transposase [Kitasatospora sp. NPDC053057]|uniref:transposase n=1 Tax=Kitasatospora sp. NPDC053057 TaxID=3364062 RepID=UPI0037C938BF